MMKSRPDVRVVGAVRIVIGDAIERLRELPDGSVHCCVTSPPYWGLRDYGVAGQIGLEATPQEYVEKMVAVFADVRRVLRRDGTLWLVLGDCYASGPSDALRSTGLMGPRRSNHAFRQASSHKRVPEGYKPKDLIGIPWRVALALQADGWWLRSDIVWSKPSPMPESVRDRPTRAHEYVFLLAKSKRYFLDLDAVREPFAAGTIKRISQASFDRQRGGPKDGLNPNRSARRALVNLKGRAMPPQLEGRPPQAQGRNIRSVWTIATEPFPEAHFATFPTELARRCILAGCPVGGVVLDLFGGSGTTGLVAQSLGRNAVLIELNPDYAAMAERRIAKGQPGLALSSGERCEAFMIESP